MTFSTSNFGKGNTPSKWGRIGNVLLILGPTLTGLFTALPLPDEAKLWILPIVGILLPFGKIFTKLFGNDTSEENYKDIGT